MQSSANISNVSSFFFDDDIDEDHFLVRKHLHRYSYGDYLNQPRPTGTSILLHKPQLSSVLKKPILFPPSNKKNAELEQSVACSIDQQKHDQSNKTLENSQSSEEPLCSVSCEEVNQTEPVSNQEFEFSKLTPRSPTPRVPVDSENESHETKIHEGSCHGDDRQVSTPDSLEEMEDIRDLRKNQLEDGEFKMDKTESDATAAIKSQNCNRMSKIISYDEALNIPQTDDDKERMTTSRRKERPANLLMPTPNAYRSTSRPTSARTCSRKYLGVEDRRDSFLGSLQSLNSSSRTPLTPRSPNNCQLSPDAERQDFLRRTQSFRGSRSVGGGRRATMGPELVNHIQESAKSLSSKFEYLTPKDQKVLAVLLAKREQEKEEERLKEEMQHLWEAEKVVRDKVPRLKVTEATPCGQLRPSTSRQNLHFRESFSDLYRSTSRLSLHQTGVKDNPCGHRTSEECLTESCLVFRSLALEERKQNENRLKLQQALERKKRVELRLEEQKKKNEEHAKELREKHQHDLERAMTIKKERNEQIKQKMSKQIESTKQKLEQLKSKKMSDQELSNIEENMKASLSVAELKAKKMKEEEANKIGKKRQMKVEKAQQNHRSMEEELKLWQEQAKNYRHQQDRHAEELQAIQLAQRKEALMRSREAKEKAQKQNLQRILEREKEWRSSLEASILNKEERTKLLNQEKESLVQKSRAQAQLTKRLREELKLNQSLTDLDKLSKYVALQRKILS